MVEAEFGFKNINFIFKLLILDMKRKKDFLYSFIKRSLDFDRIAIFSIEKVTCFRRCIEIGMSLSSFTTPLPTVPKPIIPTPTGADAILSSLPFFLRNKLLQKN